MADATLTNGSLPNVEILSKEQAKAIHAQLNRFYKKETSSKKKQKPLLKPIGDINVETKQLKIQKSPVDFDDLKTGMLFSLDPTGTVLYAKSGKERALCLNTMSPVPVGGASVYRVFL